jgi:hypothetical protein
MDAMCCNPIVIDMQHMIICEERVEVIRKILYGLIGCFVFLIVGLIAGLIVGSFIGGNFMMDFEFAGVMGYEATGLIGAMIGGPMGAIAGIMIGVSFASRSAGNR